MPTTKSTKIAARRLETIENLSGDGNSSLLSSAGSFDKFDPIKLLAQSFKPICESTSSARLCLSFRSLGYATQ